MVGKPKILLSSDNIGIQIRNISWESAEMVKTKETQTTKLEPKKKRGPDENRCRNAQWNNEFAPIDPSLCWTQRWGGKSWAGGRGRQRPNQTIFQGLKMENGWPRPQPNLLQNTNTKKISMRLLERTGLGSSFSGKRFPGRYIGPDREPSELKGPPNQG